MLEQEITIVWPHPPDPSGGPGTFQQHVIDNGLDFGIRTIDGLDQLPDVVLVTAGTRRLWWLWRLRRREVRIVQRLDGVHWRDYLQPIGLKAKTRAYLSSSIVAFIRRHLADYIVYQSEFVREHWNRRFGTIPTPDTVVLNGTNLDAFKPSSTASPQKPVLLAVEGDIQPGTWVVEIVTEIATTLVPDVLSKVALVGEASDQDRARLEAVDGVELMGSFPRATMPDIYRSADLFLNLEVHPPCPNSVVEALASGLPVAAFDTGSARELIGNEAGVLVPYGADAWKLEKPDIGAMIEAIRQMVGQQASMSAAARDRSRSLLSLDRMLEGYRRAFDDSLR